MARKRLPINRGLPPRWAFKSGAYYYLPRPGERANYDGKQWFRLGRTLAEAHTEFARRQHFEGELRNMEQLCERYALEVIPGKAAATRKSNEYSMQRIRRVFGISAIAQIQPRDIYLYRDQVARKYSEKQYNLDHELLSHMFTKAIEWGARQDHPMTNKRVVKFSLQSRTRYVEDWELAAFRQVCPPLIDAYLELKGLTGLRRGDLLSLTSHNLADEGLRLVPRKTARHNSRPLIYAWTPELEAAVAAIKALPRPASSSWLFCTRQGEPYIKEDGQASGWDSAWRRAMEKALRDTDLAVPFREHDLRAKVASDAETVSRAQELLNHSSPATTRKHYLRKAAVVQPASGFSRDSDGEK